MGECPVLAVGRAVTPLFNWIIDVSKLRTPSKWWASGWFAGFCLQFCAFPIALSSVKEQVSQRSEERST